MRQIFKHADLLTASLDHFLANPAEFHSPWPDLVPMDTQTRAMKEETAYFISDRGTMGYLRVVPRRDPAEASGEWKSLDAAGGDQCRGRRGASGLEDRPDGRCASSKATKCAARNGTWASPC